MTERLNIPLNTKTTTRRIHWRVVWIYTSIALGITAALCSFHLYNHIDRTSKGINTEHLSVFHFQNSPKLYKEAFLQIRTTPIFTGAPITLDDILANTTTDFAMYMQSGEVHAVAYTGQISNHVLNLAKESGLSVQSDKKRHIISATELQISKKWSISLKELLFANGTLIENDKRSSIKMKSDRVVIKQKTDQEPQNDLFAEEILVFAGYDTENLLNLPIYGQLINPYIQILKSDGDAQYYLTFKNTDFSNEQLANLGKNLILNQNLSTLALTIDSETTVQEIVNPSKSINPNISINENSTHISLEDDFGNTLKITKTPTIITITNIDNVPKASKNSSKIISYMDLGAIGELNQPDNTFQVAQLNQIFTTWLDHIVVSTKRIEMYKK